MSSTPPRQPLAQLPQTAKPHRLRPLKHSQHISRLIPMQPLHPVTIPRPLPINQHSFPTGLRSPHNIFLILIPDVNFPPLVRVHFLMVST